MTEPTYPSAPVLYRRADMGVHIVGLLMILTAGTLLITRAEAALTAPLVIAAIVYILSALGSNLASWAYHFLPWHERRVFLRRIDHAAIYPSIAGTFTPFFILADTTWTWALLVISWALSVIAIWNKLTNENVKSRWSTASYLGLGAIGLCALPDLTNVPLATLWCIIGGAVCYVIGTWFYARRAMPFRYAIWHGWVNLGALMMFAGVWMALFW